MFFTYVREDQRDGFEGFLDFMKESTDTLGAEDPEFARNSSTFRALSPTETNEDGTVTYVLMADPLHEGTETGIDAILSRLYTEKEVAEHRKPWDDAVARPQDAYRFVQAREMSIGNGSKAAPGEPVVMFFTHVLAEHQDAFEGFVEFLDGVLEEISAADATHARQSGTVRALYPAEPNEDGTLTYLFMADPLIDGTETSIRATLARVYPEEEVEELMRPWNDAQARPQENYRFVQSGFNQ